MINFKQRKYSALSQYIVLNPPIQISAELHYVVEGFPNLIQEAAFAATGLIT